MKKLFLIVIIMLVVFFKQTYALRNTEVAAPSYSVNYINDYTNSFTCKYRMQISDRSPIYDGSFDIVVNFSKSTLKATSVTVKQVSKDSLYLHTNNIGKINAENKISDIKYNRGYSCPSLMVYLTDNSMAVDEGFITANFAVEKFDMTKYSSTKSSASVNQYYNLKSYESVQYNCSYSEDECKESQYCKWGVIDSGHNDYACYEKNYNTSSQPTTEENDNNESNTDTTRTEKCSGYVEKVFNQSVEYSFGVDGSFYLTLGTGEFAMNYAQDFVDKDGVLYEKWKAGNCCDKNKLGITYKDDKTIVSCDGTASTWEFSDGEVPKLELNVDPQSCQDLLGDPTNENTPAYYITFAFKVLKYVAILVLLIITTMEFVGAVASQDNDIIKKATNKALIRALLCIAIFLLPTIIEFLLQFIHEARVSDCMDF